MAKTVAWRAGPAALGLVICCAAGIARFEPSAAAADNPLAAGHARMAAKDWASARAEYAKAAEQADAPPAVRAIACLRIAQSYLRERNLAAARAEYAKVDAMTNSPAHLRQEASRQIQAIDRLAKGLPSRDPLASRTPMPQSPVPGATLYVAADGSDSNDGASGHPFATLERARDEIRAMKKKGPLPPGGVSVLVRGRRYPVARTFHLTQEDSGTADSPIIYRSTDGQAAEFSGGVRLSGFTTVSDPAILARLPEEARGKVVQADLQAAGAKDLLPLKLGGYASGFGFTTHPVLELFFNGEAMQLARWPNEGFVKVASVSTGQAPPAAGTKGPGEVVLTYGGDRPSRWKGEQDIWLYGYWFHDWADSYQRVASVDAQKRQITLAPPYPTYGFRTGQRFYALNVLSEIDRPGEWYLDRVRGRLYLYPPSDPAQATVEMSVAAFPFVVLENVSHVRLEGLLWQLGCGDGIIVRGGGHCVLAGCTVRQFGGNGVEIRGGASHTVLSCDVYSMGRGGVVVSGGDRRTLAPGGHVVENCYLHHLSRVDHTYTPAVHMTGVGNRIAHNLMHDIGSSAINLGGNDHTVEFNEVCRAVLESDDQGGVDMYGDPTYRGNVYRYNYFHHIGNWRHQGEEPACGQAGIRLDDAISGVLVYGNVFYRCSAGKAGFGGVQIHGGKDNIVDGNVFADCAAAISFSPWGDKRWRDFTRDTMNSRQIDKTLYQSRYPLLARLSEDHDTNAVWRNLAFHCGEFLRRGHGGLALLDNLATADNPGFTDAPHGVFALADDAPALDRVSLPPIPFDEIGLYADAFRKDLPAARVKEMRAEP